MDRKTRMYIQQALKDSGFPVAEAEHILGLMETGEAEKFYCLLKRQRCNLLDTLHEVQRRIDCLDFFIRKMKKEGLAKNG